MHEETVYDALTNAHDDAGHWAFGTGFDDPLAGVDTTVPDGVDPADLGAYCLMLGDDALVLAPRLTERVTRSPELEAQAAADAVWPLTAQLFTPTDVERRLTDAGVAVDPAGLREEVRDVLTTVLQRATLTVPPEPADAEPRGRAGEHSAELTALLATL